MNNDIFSGEDWQDTLVDQPPVRVTKRLRDYDIPLLHQIGLMVFSAGLAFLSLIPLYFTELASSFQSQTAYMSWALTQGQLPYLAVFSRSGLLYSGLVGLATVFGGVQWLILVQLLCFYLAGNYAYKLLYYWTSDQRQAFGLTQFFYLVNAGLGFGGFYPIQLATPFVLIGLWLLVTYLDDLRRDEIFMLYGLVAGLALTLEPRTLLFWILAFLVLSGHNIAKKRWARGFYQNLAISFGLTWVFYPLAYFAVNLELATPYFQQAFVESFSTLLSFSPQAYLPMGINLVVALALGLVTGLLFVGKVFRKIAEQVMSVVLLSLATLIYLAVVLLSQSNDLGELLLVLPFGLLLTGLFLSPEQSIPETGRLSRRRQAPATSGTSSLLKRHAYLPLLVLLASLVWRLLPLATHQTLQAERDQLAQYLAGQTTEEMPIYAWDHSSSIYLTSQRLAASQFPVPVAYPNTASHQQLIVDDLLQGRASYIVVNTNLPLPAQLQEKLATAYQELPLENISQFKLYQKN